MKTCIYTNFVVSLSENQKFMAEQNNTNTWHWQEPGTAWKGIGIYHITLTIPTREPLLGTLLIPNNDPKQATIQRTELGDQLVECLLSVPKYHPNIRVVSFCLMPDHLHTIWHVVRPMESGIGSVVRGFWQATKKIGRNYSMLIAPNAFGITSINKKMLMST